MTITDWFKRYRSLSRAGRITRLAEKDFAHRNFEAAQKHASEALQTYETFGLKPERMEMSCLSILGQSLFYLGNFSEAERIFGLASKMIDQVPNPSMLLAVRFAGFLSDFGEVKRAQRDLDAAEKLFNRSLELLFLYQGLSKLYDLTKPYLGLANICAAKGDFAQAEKYFELALSKVCWMPEKQWDLRELQRRAVDEYAAFLRSTDRETQAASLQDRIKN